MPRLRAFFKLERGEEFPVLLLFLSLTIALANFVVAKAVRDALFLDRFRADALPYVYVAVALSIGAVVSVYIRLAARVSQLRLISATLVFFMTNVVVIWWGVRRGWAPMAAVFYVWTSLFGIILTVQVWTLASSLLNARQARRLFPLVGSGGILGATLGGLLAALLVKSLGTENLILVLLLLLGVSLGLAQVVGRCFCPAGLVPCSAGIPPRKLNILRVLRMTFASPYLRLIALLLAIAAVVTLTVDFQFKLIAQDAIEGKDSLTRFFGSFHAYVGAAAFLLQILIGPRVFEKHGLRLTLLVLPVALLAGTAVLLAFPLSLLSGILLKGSEGTLRHSIDRSTIEALYVPIPESVKTQVKAVIDMVLQRLADGLGGVLLLAMTAGLGLGLRGLALFNALLIGAWIWTATRTRKQYVAAVRSTLAERQIVPESALRSAFRDPESLQTLRAMMNDADEEVVLYAMEVALAVGRRDLLSKRLLDHPSRNVRLRAIEEIPLTADDLLAKLRDEPDIQVRAKAMGRACRVTRPESPLAAVYEQLAVPDLRLRLAALSCLAQQVPESEAKPLRRYLSSVTGDLPEDSVRWKDVAEALGEIHHPAAVDLHLKLLHHPNPEVRLEAVRGAGRAGHRALVPFLIRMLSDRRLAIPAERALQEYGPRILGTLGDVLRDPAEPMEVRRAIPGVLAGIPHQGSVDLLLQALEEPDGALRFQALRALNKLRLREEGFRFDRPLLTRRIQEEAAKALAYQRALVCLYPEATRDLLEQLLREKVRQARERVFRLVGLILPPATAHAASNALLGDDRDRRASAAEYLDNALPEELRRSVLPLAEGRPVVASESARKILENCLRNGDALLAECARDAIGKDRWPEFPAAELPAFARERKTAMSETTPFEPLISEGAAAPGRMTALQKAEFLRRFEPFSHATVEELLRLATIAKEVPFAPGDVLLLEGERAEALYLIVEGEVEASRLGQREKFTVGRGTPVGGFAVLARDPQPFTVRAVTEGFVLKLDAEELYDMLSHNVEIVFSIFRMLVRKIGADPRTWTSIPVEARETKG